MSATGFSDVRDADSATNVLYGVEWHAVRCAPRATDEGTTTHEQFEMTDSRGGNQIVAAKVTDTSFNSGLFILLQHTNGLVDKGPLTVSFRGRLADPLGCGVGHSTNWRLASGDSLDGVLSSVGHEMPSLRYQNTIESRYSACYSSICEFDSNSSTKVQGQVILEPRFLESRHAPSPQEWSKGPRSHFVVAGASGFIGQLLTEWLLRGGAGAVS